MSRPFCCDSEKEQFCIMSQVYEFGVSGLSRVEVKFVEELRELKSWSFG